MMEQAGALVAYVVEKVGAAYGSSATLWGLGFIGACLAIDLLRRRGTLNWSRRKLQGFLASLTIFHINFLFVPFVWTASIWLQAFYGALGLPVGNPDFWRELPYWVTVPVAIVLYDFANYWNHRAMHMKWLWPIHAVHHSDPDVNLATSYRVHVLEALVMWGSYTILLSWAGLPPGAIGSAAILLAIHNIYVHIDLDWDHGPFRYVLASPRFHRWHHADVPEAYGKNLANVFPIFDRMFGTWYVPGPCTSPLGADGIPRNDVARLMLWPFIAWGRTLRDDFAEFRDAMRRDREA